MNQQTIDATFVPPVQVVSELTYINYVVNRHDYGMSAEAAANIYGDAEAMERLYQYDLANGNI